MDGRFPRLFRSITKTQLLILDDWGPDRLTAPQRRDLMEIVEERYGRGATLPLGASRRLSVIAVQSPAGQWNAVIRLPANGLLHNHLAGQRITSQLPITAWHDIIAEPTFADAILDRVRAFLRTGGSHALTSQCLPPRSRGAVHAQNHRQKG